MLARAAADQFRPESAAARSSAFAPATATACPTSQAQRILEMQLQRLTGLEQDKILVEYREVIAADRGPAGHPRASPSA